MGISASTTPITVSTRCCLVGSFPNSCYSFAIFRFLYPHNLMVPHSTRNAELYPTLPPLHSSLATTPPNQSHAALLPAPSSDPYGVQIWLPMRYDLSIPPSHPRLAIPVYTVPGHEPAPVPTAHKNYPCLHAPSSRTTPKRRMNQPDSSLIGLRAPTGTHTVLDMLNPMHTTSFRALLTAQPRPRIHPSVHRHRLVPQRL